MKKWDQIVSYVKGEKNMTDAAMTPSHDPNTSPPNASGTRQPKPQAAGSNSIVVGQQGKFKAALTDNGVEIGLPASSTWQWRSDDLAIQITQDLADPTGGTVDVLVPAGTTQPSFNLTASTTDPNGSPVTFTQAIDIIPIGGTHVYAVTITQLA